MARSRGVVTSSESPSAVSPRKGNLAWGLLAAAAAALVTVSALARENHPARPEVDLLTRAKVLWADGDLAGAEAAARESLKNHPSDLSASQLLGRILLDAGRAAESRLLFTEVLKQDPKNVQAMRGLGLAYQGLGQLELAASCLSGATGLAPKDARIWRELGLVQKQKGDTWGAMSSLQESLSLDPAQADLTALISDLASAGPEGPGRPVPALATPKVTRTPGAPPDPTQHFPKPATYGR